MSEPQHDKGAWVVAGVTSAAVIAGLSFKGVSGETISDAVKDIGGTLLPLVGALVAAGMVTRKMDAEASVLEIAESALRRVQDKNRGLLTGPKSNKSEPDDGGGGKNEVEDGNEDRANRYLFVQVSKDGKKGKKGQFIPVAPLEDGILTIKIQRQALKSLGIEGDLCAAQEHIIPVIRERVAAVAARQWKNSHVLTPTKDKNVAINIDFDEGAMSKRDFGKAIEQCAGAAFLFLREEVDKYKSRPNNA